MITSFIRYVIDPNKQSEFEEYGRRWIALIEKYGGIHHGYFVPEEFPETSVTKSFSFPGLGSEGPANVAVALFTFPTLEAYETYRREVGKDDECKSITAHFNDTKCFLSYERSFMKPIG